jgi:hypothetical protein
MYVVSSSTNMAILNDQTGTKVELWDRGSVHPALRVALWTYHTLK